MDDVLAVILGGGRGTRLFPLTAHRSKPAVPIGGKYRLIDIPVSNCLNSDLRRIFVLTQYNSESLNKHLNSTYKFDIFSNAFVSVLAAEQTEDSPDWFQGTADAVRQSLRHLRSHPSRDPRGGQPARVPAEACPAPGPPGTGDRQPRVCMGREGPDSLS